MVRLVREFMSVFKWGNIIRKELIRMTATQEKLANILSESSALVPFMPDEQAAQIIDIFMTVKVEAQVESADTERKDLAQHRRELLRSRKYVRPSGRTHGEIDAEIREMRSDRF